MNILTVSFDDLVDLRDQAHRLAHSKARKDWSYEDQYREMHSIEMEMIERVDRRYIDKPWWSRPTVLLLNERGRVYVYTIDREGKRLVYQQAARHEELGPEPVKLADLEGWTGDRLAFQPSEELDAATF